MEENCFAILFNAGKILLSDHGGVITLPGITRDIENLLPPEEELFSTVTDGIRFMAADIAVCPEGLISMDLRESWRVLPHIHYRAAAKGAELLHWNRQTRFCRKCGAPLLRHSGISKLCTGCGIEEFPSMAPCVIVLVTRGDGEDEEALLVHARNFRRPFYGLVAGFVETGESLEECVAREVMEETSLEVEDIRYFGSQSWPFPSQMMLGFTARWKRGEVEFADGELSDGGFYRRDALPALATPPSIARRLIDAWIDGTLRR